MDGELNATRAALKLYEAKLKELMPPKEYAAFVEETARAMFLGEVMSSPNEDFRQVVIDNWDAITAPVISEEVEE